MTDINKKIEELKKLKAYTFGTHTQIPELKADGITLEHKKTGARVFLLLCDDTNKVFSIGFRTPPRDDTGVAHIVEHSVLCGSRKYPCKDPFVELAKGSLNTFLNAITFPDKTIYPIASVNTKDFENLMDVYLDAVLHPNIYTEPKIFMQEGWHYELADDKLSINGVVYNEMKGAYSDPADALDVATNSLMYEGHIYGYESGGDPKAIPTLTYENFIDFHRTYYHPSNSYIYLYGDLDAAKYLEYIDTEYLSDFDKIDVESQIPEAKCWEGMRESTCTYALAENENDENATTLSWNKLVGGIDDPIKYTAFMILEDILINVPGALVQEALIKAGIGTEISGGYSHGLRTPYFSITAKMTDESRKEEFLEIIRSVLQKAVDEGIEKDMLYAAINSMEFKSREANYGTTPKGLVYGIDGYDSWLYDMDPCMHIRFEEAFDTLKKGVADGYFESLIKDYLLDGNSEGVIVLKPEKGLTLKKQKELDENLESLRATLSEDELRKISDNGKALREYQTEPVTKEDLLKIPLLKREDIGKEPMEVVWDEKSIAEKKTIHSNIFTSDIIYIKIFFGMGGLSDAELSRAALLKDVLGYIDTEKYSYAQLSTKVHLVSGGIGYNVDCLADLDSTDRASFYALSLNIKVLPSHMHEVFELVDEMLYRSKLSDTGRLTEILSEVKTSLKDRLISSGHLISANRSLSHISSDAKFGELTSGIAYYRYLDSISKSGDMTVLARELEELATKLFTYENMLVGVICDDAGYATFEENIKPWLGRLPHGADMLEAVASPSDVTMVKEAFGTSSQVNYVARGGNYKAHGFKYTGHLKILRVMLSYEYLWSNIRVTGGAYGCMTAFQRNGDTHFVSYRDPNFDRTRKVYEGILDFVSECDYDEREMTKYIIGAIRDLDKPLTPLLKGLQGIGAYISHVDMKDVRREREEILSATHEDIQALAPLIKAVLSDGQECAICSEKSMSEEALDFTNKEPLFAGE